MSEKTTAKKETEIDKAVKLAIIRGGDVISIPTTVTLGTAIDIMKSQLEFEEQTIQIERWFENVPWADAALGIHNAMEKVFLWVEAQAIKGMFGETPPRMVKVKSGPNGETVNVPVGQFKLSMADDALCQVVFNGVACGFATRVKRKFEAQMNRMLDLAEHLMVEESLYRRRALTFSRKHMEEFDETVDDLGFMTVGGDFALLLTDEVTRDIKANILTLLTKKDECKALGIPSKRSVLMYGPYGTGKTLAAHQTAQVAKETGHTFVYVTDIDDLSEAYRFARTMSPSVLFVEDIDRNVGDNDYVAELSTVLDGINTKDSDVILIATTNHVEKIPPILLRPGRIDASIEVGPPDAATVRKLIKHYAPTTEGDIEPAAEHLAGQIPAIIREACERAKLFALADDRENLTGTDILDAAKSMGRQMALLEKATKPKGEPTSAEHLYKSFKDVVVEAAQSVN